MTTVPPIETQEVLSGAVLIATSSCLVCLSSIKRVDAVGFLCSLT